MPSPDTSGTQNQILSGFSYISASACAAVGEIVASSLQTLVEMWNGSSWSIVPSPNSASDEDNGLRPGSCVTPSACASVGAFNNGDGQTLIEQWDGSSWSIVSPARTQARAPTTASKRCRAPRPRRALPSVGYAGTVFQTLIEMLPGLPVVSSVSPPVGPPTGGGTVTLSGSNFLGATAIDFGLTASPSFTVTSDTTITAQVPPGSPGTVDVTVTSPRGTSATSSADQYTYRIPGYDLAGSDGGVFVFPVGQSSGFFGSLPGLGVKVSNTS